MGKVARKVEPPRILVLATRSREGLELIRKALRLSCMSRLLTATISIRLLPVTDTLGTLEYYFSPVLCPDSLTTSIPRQLQLRLPLVFGFHHSQRDCCSKTQSLRVGGGTSTGGLPKTHTNLPTSSCVDDSGEAPVPWSAIDSR